MNGTLLNNPKVTSSILEKLAEAIFQYTAYPTGLQVLKVVEALVEKFPCLKEPGSFNGMYGWQQRIKYKMGNYRAKLRGRQLACPELEVNSFKRKNTNDELHLKGIKRPKKTEVNYLPPFPCSETEETLEQERVSLLQEMKDNNRVVVEKMEKTFSYRRLEIVKHSPTVPEIITRWPALFCEPQVKDEFRRITTVHLERTFLTKLDMYTPRLLEIFKKGGVAGTKIKCLMDSFSQQPEGRRDGVIRCLINFLGESCEDLITDYQDVNKDMIKDSFPELAMKIIVLGRAAAEEGSTLKNVIIIIDGTEVLDGCKNLTNACLLLMGLIYSLNLSYLPKLRHTFEVFQKILLELDILKLSPKVYSLQRKLLMFIY